MILLYIFIFIFIVASSAASDNKLINNKYNNNIILFVLVFLLSFSIYNVQLHHFIDLPNYYRWFRNANNISFLQLDIFEEPLFHFLQWIIYNLSGSFRIFLVVVWTIIFTNMFKAIKNIFPNNYTLYVLFTYFTYFLFFNYVLNVMRQGLAISFIILGFSYLINGDKTYRWRFYIPTMMAPLFHITSLPISIFLVILYNKKISLKWGLFTWFGASFLFLTNLNNNLFSNIRIPQLETYTSTSVLESYREVNRVDFYIFSAFFLCIGLLIRKYIFSNKNHQFDEILNSYLFFNSYYLILGFIAYSDRLVSYSWMLIPILIWKSVPNTKYQYFKIFMIVVLSFLLSAFSPGLQTLILIN